MEAENQKIELIRKMVVNGLYRVCLVEGYRPEVFAKLKEEQNRLFDNYIHNQALIRERNVRISEEKGSAVDTALASYEDAIRATITSGKVDKILSSDKARYLQNLTEDVQNKNKAFQGFLASSKVSDVKRIISILAALKQHEGTRAEALAEMINIEKDVVECILESLYETGVVSFSWLGEHKYYYLNERGAAYIAALGKGAEG